MGPTLFLNLGICLVAFGLVWHFSKLATDDDYLFYWVDIIDPKETTALLPIYIMSRSSATFENVDCWWAPWGSEATIYPENATNPYWSIGHQMKVFFPLVRGGTKYGRSIAAGDYLIQYDTTLKGANYHFDERLNVQVQNRSLVQKIEVWKTAIPGGNRKLVYSGGSPKDPAK